jgi:hypothetical protein
LALCFNAFRNGVAGRWRLLKRNCRCLVGSRNFPVHVSMYAGNHLSGNVALHGKRCGFGQMGSPTIRLAHGKESPL